jgi:hypothetical protein
MDLQKEPSTGRSLLTARHNITVRHLGEVPYGRIQLKIAYFDQNDSLLAEEIHSMPEKIQPGARLNFNNITINHLPAGVVKSRLSIAFADIDPPSAPSPPDRDVSQP